MNETRPDQARDSAAIVAAIREGEKFCLLTHERPDGDALGSLIGMHFVLGALGKESLMVVDAADVPPPAEYRFLPLDAVRTTLPADLADRTVIYLDCGNIDRNPVPVRSNAHGPVLNIDHHHDNTRFGDVDLVDPQASSTAEMVWGLMADLGVRADHRIAEALYVGIVTDTGKFMYENTTSATHRAAADMIDAGVDTHAVYRHLYEEVPFAKLELLGRALKRIVRADGGRLAFVSLTREDFDAVGADDGHSEGIIDHLRALEGTKVAAFGRQLDRTDEDGHRLQKVSVRSTDGQVDVSAIARAGGGGGHPQAAGFTTALGDEALVRFLREQIAAQLDAAPAA